MKKALFIIPAILAILAFPLAGIGQQSAPAPKQAEAGKQHPGQHHGGSAPDGEGSGNMMERCKEMMAKHGQISDDIKAMDARLDEKVSAMNAAKPDEKVAAMAAVISELVSQRKEMRDKMGEMHHGKMCRMMCPMMGRGGHAGGAQMGHGGHHGKGGMHHECPMMEKQGAPKHDHGSGDAPGKKPGTT